MRMVKWIVEVDGIPVKNYGAGGCPGTTKTLQRVMTFPSKELADAFARGLVTSMGCKADIRVTPIEHPTTARRWRKKFGLQQERPPRTG